MAKRVLKKLLSTLITLFAVSFIVFLAFDIIPGDAATAQLGTEATPERLADLREQLGLNRPFIVRYFAWLWDFVRGDFGVSYSYSIPVSQMLAGKLPITITMITMSFLMIVLVSIPLGVYNAAHQGGVLDRFFMIINQIIMAIPPFFSGILITFIFGITLKLFVPGGFVSYTKDVAQFLGYMVFPSLAVAIPKIAMTTKLLRNSILDEADKDYVRTAYSRGNRTRGVLYNHVLKNAMIPTVTFLGMVLADMIAGSIIIEQVFNIPGFGRILITSISNRDFPVAEAVIMIIAVIVVVVNFIVDILYRVIDPRMREN